MMKNKWRILIIMVLAAATCLLATGCMGGQKDITKADEEKYEAIVAEACEEYGYEYDKQTVFPLGAELLYHLSNGDDEVVIEVNIDEESAYDKVSCEFSMTRNIGAVSDAAKGLEEHLDVLTAIAGHFTDEITKDALIEYLDSDAWTEGQGEDDFVVSKEDIGSMSHTIYEDGDELEEVFSFWWDNGKKYSFKNK